MRWTSSAVALRPSPLRAYASSTASSASSCSRSRSSCCPGYAAKTCRQIPLARRSRQTGGNSSRVRVLRRIAGLLRSLLRSRLVVAAHTPVGVRPGLASAHLRHSVTTGQPEHACLASVVAFSRARGSSVVLTSSMANRAGLVWQARGWSETGKGIRVGRDERRRDGTGAGHEKPPQRGARRGVVWRCGSGVVVAAAASRLDVGGEPPETGFDRVGRDPRFGAALADRFSCVGAHRCGPLAQGAGAVLPAVEILTVAPVEEPAGSRDQTRLHRRPLGPGTGHGRNPGSCWNTWLSKSAVGFHGQRCPVRERAAEAPGRRRAPDAKHSGAPTESRAAPRRGPGGSR
ncbi:hypothetical protein STIB_70620 [Streptomyces sp. IB2014 011-1]|nr:hypothetical protein STIB_70620 [Streptomyces sp. IB2014 011-1]